MKNLTMNNNEMNNNNEGLVYSFTFKDICNGVDIDSNEGMMTKMNNKLMNEIMETVNREIMEESREVVEAAANEFLVVEDTKRIARIRNRINKKDFSIKVYNSINNLKPRIEDEKVKLIEEYYDGLKRSLSTSFKNQKALEKASKEIPTCLIKQIKIDLIEDNEKSEIVRTVFTQPCQDSELLKSAKTEEMFMGDETMGITAPGTYKISSLSLGAGITNNQSVLAREKLINLFTLIMKENTTSKGIFIVVSKSGKSRLAFNESNLNLEEGDIAYKYLFLGITASGFRSGSLTLSAVKEIYADGTIVECDNRNEILNNASDKAFLLSFKDENGEDKKFNDFTELFKEAGRILLVSTASTRLGQVETYIVLNNIAEGAGYSKDNTLKACISKNEDFVDCKDTQDGGTFTSEEFLKKNCIENKIPFDKNTILGICKQTRGGGTKDSTRFVSQKLMKILVLNAISKGQQIERIVFRGQDVTLDELKANNQLNDFYNEIQHIGDSNSMKLIKHEAIWNMVELKQAHASDTCLNMVINIAMLFQNVDKASELLMDYGTKAIFEKFEQFGFKFTFDEDRVLDHINFCPENIKEINNDSQLINHYYKNNPELTLAIMSSLLKSALKNEVISIKNLVNTLRISVESKYMVVQSDIAPLFGFRLLNDDEVFSNEFNGLKRVSAARHPISGFHAVSTFKVIGIETIVDRLNKVEGINVDIKNELIKYFMSTKSFVHIPASHYLMEKHDGMDFDIDSMQWFTDEKVVDILSKIPELGTKINRKIDIEKGISESKSEKEKIIAKFQKDHSKNIVDLLNGIKQNAKNKIDKNIKAAFHIGKTKSTGKKSTSKCVRNLDGTYTASFDNIAKMVLDYFLNPVDPIGFMATDFYNNALLYILMQDSKTTNKKKQFIAHAFKKAFKCNNNCSYISPLQHKTEDGRTEVILHKEAATDILFNFANSNGTVEDVTEFLYDACICNRYPAETSIDAAKKNYVVTNIFSFRFIIKALGSDKTMKTRLYGYNTNAYDEEMITSNVEYDSILEDLNENLEEGNYSKGNFFNIGLLHNEIKDDEYIVDEYLEDEKCSVEDCLLEGQTPCIYDPLAIIRRDLTKIANTLIVVVTKELEHYILSESSSKIRAEYKNKYLGTFDENQENFFNICNVINSTVITYMSLTEGLKEMEEITERNENDDIDKIHAREYKKTVALQACRNTAKLAFKASKETLTDIEIGCAAVFSIINSFEEGLKDCSCKTLNTSLLTIFEREIDAFFTSEGINTQIGESILYASSNDRQFSLETLIGQHVIAYKGKATIEYEEKEINIEFKNRKATLDGTIEKIDDKFYVIAEKDYLVEDEKAGIFLSVLMNNNVATCEYINNNNDVNDFIDISFNKRYVDEFGRMHLNTLVGTNENNEEIAIASLFANSSIAEILNNIELKTNSINIFKSEKRICIHFNHNSIVEELSFVDSVDNGFDFNMDEVLLGCMDGIAMIKEDSSYEEVAIGMSEDIKDLLGDVVLPQ